MKLEYEDKPMNELLGVLNKVGVELTDEQIDIVYAELNRQLAEAYEDGHSVGLNEDYEDGYDGYDEGFSDGYDVGYYDAEKYFSK